MTLADELTPKEIEDQYGKIRSAAVQFWLTMVALCVLGAAVVGAPLLFIALAAVHTAGLPFVLAYARRWRDGLLSAKK
jgi:hypothetical protein